MEVQQDERLSVVMPDAEVVVRFGGSDVCVVGFFFAATQLGTYDAAVGISDVTSSEVVRGLLQDASDAILHADWQPILGDGEESLDPNAKPPF